MPAGNVALAWFAASVFSAFMNAGWMKVAVGVGRVSNIIPLWAAFRALKRPGLENLLVLPDVAEQSFELTNSSAMFQFLALVIIMQTEICQF